VPANTPSATRVTIAASSTGVLAFNVAALKIDFTSPASENGYCGYAQIAVFGNAVTPAVPSALSATFPTTDSRLVIDIKSMVIGRNYTIESTTNLASNVWTSETNFVATESAVLFTNSAAIDPQKFYRVVGY
jgi:hypothetical protein